MAEKQQRRWQLGKEAPVAPASKPAPRPAAAKPPGPPKPKLPPARLPSAYGPLDEDADQSKQPPGRQRAAAASTPRGLPRTPREVLGHPITLVVVGIGACLAVFLLAFGPTSGVRLGGPKPVTLTSSETLSAFLGGTEVVIPGSDVRLPAVEPEQVRDARVLLGAGQVLQRVVEWRRAYGEGRAPAPQTVQFLAPAFMNAPVPQENGRDYYPATVLRDEATANAMLATQEAMRRSVGTSLTMAAVEATAALLLAEGHALVETSGDAESMARLPRAAGARERLETARATADPAQIPAVLSTLLPEDFAAAIGAVRARYMTVLYPVVTEATPTP